MTEKKWKMKQAFEKLMEELAGCVNIIDGKRFLAVLEEFFIEIRRVQKEERYTMLTNREFEASIFKNPFTIKGLRAAKRYNYMKDKELEYLVKECVKVFENSFTLKSLKNKDLKNKKAVT